MGLDLRNPIFAHDQLYVALSRVQAKKNIIILVKNDHIEDKPNVYTVRELLRCWFSTIFEYIAFDTCW